MTAAARFDRAQIVLTIVGQRWFVLPVPQRPKDVRKLHHAVLQATSTSSFTSGKKYSPRSSGHRRDHSGPVTQLVRTAMETLSRGRVYGIFVVRNYANGDVKKCPLVERATGRSKVPCRHAAFLLTVKDVCSPVPPKSCESLRRHSKVH
jgi:hypothetical protein